ncbi:hypothetical protein [Bosea massiliensis]|uniref:Histidine kinase n=1 Tax=Bosea massiliensis TaxID=151419 RepID=A0ABW0P007_9HYPH
MTRNIRLTVETSRKAVVIDMAPRHACNEQVIQDVFRSPEFSLAYRSGDDASVSLPVQTMVNRMRGFELCARILDIQRDAAMRVSLIEFRDAVLDAAGDPSLRIHFGIGNGVVPEVDEEAMRIDPNRYLTPLRQQELIDLSDAGQGASAVRLAIRETAAAFSRQLHLH